MKWGRDDQARSTPEDRDPKGLAEWKELTPGQTVLPEQRPLVCPCTAYKWTHLGTSLSKVRPRRLASLIHSMHWASPRTGIQTSDKRGVHTVGLTPRRHQLELDRKSLKWPLIQPRKPYHPPCPTGGKGEPSWGTPTYLLNK